MPQESAPPARQDRALWARLVLATVAQSPHLAEDRAGWGRRLEPERTTMAPLRRSAVPTVRLPAGPRRVSNLSSTSWTSELPPRGSTVVIAAWAWLVMSLSKTLGFSWQLKVSAKYS